MKSSFFTVRGRSKSLLPLGNIGEEEGRIFTDEDEQFRKILDIIPAAVYATDAAGKIVYCNEAAVKLWGSRPQLGVDEWCGSWRLLRPDGSDLPHEQCPMAVALKEQRSVGGSEAVAVRPDGSRIPFIAYPTLLHDDNGEMVGAVNLLVDATDRHLAESYQQWLAAIVESSDDAIVGKDLHGIVTSWNKGAERLFGYTAQEMVGQSITRLMAPDKQDEELHILDRIGRGERVDHFETVRFRKDGNPVHISLTISPVRDRHGRIVGASKIARDITERRLAEQRQVMLVNEIKHRIKNTLATVQAIASQTLRSLNESEREAFFDRLRALSVAHDLVTTESWEVARLWDLVERVLQPFRECRDQQFMIRGPRDVALDASKSSLLCMILHELATNAIKSGSLSVDCGRVELAWEMVGDGGGRRLRLRWQETGGPPVKPPKRKGFGLLLLERAVDPQQGSACLRFDPSGFVCVLELVV